jgi:hypothetical protein
VVAVNLFHGLHILFEVTNSMLPGLESLCEQSRRLFSKISAQVLSHKILTLSMVAASLRKSCYARLW